MNLFEPKESYKRISDISLKYLEENLKIKGLIFDFDGTLMRDHKLSGSTINFIKRAKEAGFKISIVSNNLVLNHQALAELDITIIDKFALKPLKKPFLDMAKRMNLEPSEIAVIGNNKLTDIFGANRAKMYSIFIQNLNSFFFRRNVKNRLKQRGIKHIQ